MYVLKFIVCVVIALLFTHSAQATLLQASWPGPGTPLFSSSGVSPGHTGGKTWMLTDFNESAYDSLYYTLYGEIGLGSAEPMSFDEINSDLINGVSIWKNTFDIDLYNSSSSTWQTTTVQSTFTMTVEDLTGSSLGLVSANSLGLDTNFGGLLEVIDDFSVNFLFEINGTPAIEWFDSQSTRPSDGGQLRTSAGSIFFYTEPTSVSSPSSMTFYAFMFFVLVRRQVRRNFN